MIGIRDMEMPKECYRCPLLDGEYGTCNIIGKTKVDMTEERAKNCPLVEEVQEHKTGHWVKKEDEFCWWYECDQCGEKPLHSRLNDEDVLSDWCPNCGAKMVGSGKYEKYCRHSKRR